LGLKEPSKVAKVTKKIIANFELYFSAAGGSLDSTRNQFFVCQLVSLFGWFSSSGF
jgi:hypothetical protein